MTVGKKILIGVSLALTLFILGVIGIIIMRMYSVSSINDVANEQLQALRTGDLDKAYGFMSKNYQDATSFNQFQSFIDMYPALKDNASSSFASSDEKDGQGTLKGSLKDKNGGVAAVTYKMIKENSAWKILSIELNPLESLAEKDDYANANTTQPLGQSEKQPVLEKHTSIFDVRLNDTMGESKVVENNKTEYTADTAEILVSVYVEAAKKDMVVSALLTYPTGYQVGPAEKKVLDEGDIIINFSLTKPTKGWPSGDYKMTINISSGESKVVMFKVK